MTLRPRLTTATSSTTSDNAKRALGTKKTKDKTKDNKRLKTTPKDDLTTSISPDSGVYTLFYTPTRQLISPISITRSFVSTTTVSPTTTRTSVFPKWILDCGSTRHLSSTCPNNAICLPKTIPICVAGGSFVYSKYSGSVTLVCTTSETKTILTLSDVLWVPNLEYNLLSVSTLTRLGAELHYDGLRARIYGVPTRTRSVHEDLSKSWAPDVESASKKLKKLVGEAYLEDGLYFLKCRQPHQPTHAEKPSLAVERDLCHFTTRKYRQDVPPKDNLSLVAHSGCRLSSPHALSGPSNDRQLRYEIDAALQGESTNSDANLGPSLDGQERRTATPVATSTKSNTLRNDHSRPQKARFCPKLGQSSPKGLLWR